MYTLHQRLELEFRRVADSVLLLRDRYIGVHDWEQQVVI